LKLVNLILKDKETLGVKTEKGIIHLESFLNNSSDNQIPTNMMEFIKQGPSAQSELESIVSHILSSNDATYLDEEDVEWGPCVPNPSKIICVGLNYRKHADETNSPHPETPILFNKFNNTLTGHLDEIPVPKVTNKLDYEVELGIVIGKEAKDIFEEHALDHVFGYFTANDLSARDLQFRTQQWLLGKSCDKFSPIGPLLVTADEVGDPQKLALKTVVNGEVRQDSNTEDMIFSCSQIISYISQHMTLVPGDIILTGTPEGVVMGYPEEQQQYIQPGDVVTVEIEKLGALRNTFVKEN
jgi:2-keto-4-pentenoate hydratase/2-oxohepta-3-ene-1,7-dioic acid hydratase in catechol pathway